MSKLAAYLKNEWKSANTVTKSMLSTGMIGMVLLAPFVPQALEDVKTIHNPPALKR